MAAMLTVIADPYASMVARSPPTIRPDVLSSERIENVIGCGTSPSMTRIPPAPIEPSMCRVKFLGGHFPFIVPANDGTNKDRGAIL